MKRMNQNLSSENLEGVVTVASDSLVDGEQLKLKAVTMATVQQIQDVGQHGGIYAHIQDSIIHCLLILRILLVLNFSSKIKSLKEPSRHMNN